MVMSGACRQPAAPGSSVQGQAEQRGQLCGAGWARPPHRVLSERHGALCQPAGGSSLLHAAPASVLQLPRTRVGSAVHLAQ